MKRFIKISGYQIMKKEDIEKSICLWSNLQKYQRDTFACGKPTGSAVIFKYFAYITYPPAKIYIKMEFPLDSKPKEISKLCWMYLYQFNLIHGTFKNQIRVCIDHIGVYLEVKADGIVFLCDLSDLPVVEKFNWHFRASDRFVYTQLKQQNEDTITLFFHRALFVFEKYSKIMHKDKNKLNNRRHNFEVDKKSNKS